MDNKNLANVKGKKDNGLEKNGQLVEKVGGKREKSPVIQGLLEEETPRKANKRMRDEEGEGVDRFTYGVGSIMDTIELRDYTCTLGRRGREQADKLSALVTAMRVDKSTMTKPREEAFRKIRTDLMNVVDELVYAQMMMQGRLLEARHQRHQQSVSCRSPNRDSSRGERPTELPATPGDFLFGEHLEKVIAEINAEIEEEKMEVEEGKSKKKKRPKKKLKKSEKKNQIEGPAVIDLTSEPEASTSGKTEVKSKKQKGTKEPKAVIKRPKETRKPDSNLIGKPKGAVRGEIPGPSLPAKPTVRTGS